MMKKLIAASISIAVLSAALSIFGQIQIEKFDDKKVEIAGTIRSVDENGWFAINDEDHTPINIARIEVQRGYIILHYTFTASTIHSFIVTPDETFAASGFFLGASVYKNYAAISVSRLNNGIVEVVNPSKIRSAFGNIWVHGLFSVDEQI